MQFRFWGEKLKEYKIFLSRIKIVKFLFSLYFWNNPQKTWIVQLWRETGNISLINAYYPRNIKLFPLYKHFSNRQEREKHANRSPTLTRYIRKHYSVIPVSTFCILQNSNAVTFERWNKVTFLNQLFSTITTEYFEFALVLNLNEWN